MSGAPDVTKLSDQQLMALIQGGQLSAPDSANAPPIVVHGSPGAVSVERVGARPVVYDGASPQGAPAEGRAGAGGSPPTSPVQPTLQAINSGVASFAEGVPVLGGFLKEADAATAAAIAPTVEPIARHMPHLVQALMGYDPKAEIGDLPTFKQRYDAAQNIQRFKADQFHTEHPIADTGLKVGGTVAGTLAMLPALGAATAAAGPEAGLLTRAGAGAVEGGLIGAADGYGRGQGALTDPSRVRGAEMGGMFGAGGGVVLPVASRIAGTAYRNTAGRVVDALRGSRTVQAPAEETAARLAKVLSEGNPQASEMKPDRADVESALVAAQRSPLITRASNVDDAYVRIARAAARQKMTPEEMAQRARDVGPFGTLADTGESARDLLRAAVNRPGQGATIAEENLTPRQNGVFDPETGTFPVRPSSQRITDQAQAGMGLEGKDFHTEIDSLLAGRKAAAGPAYAKAYAAHPVDIGELRDFAGTPMFRDAYARARAISQKEFVQGPDGAETIQPLPPLSDGGQSFSDVLAGIEKDHPSVKLSANLDRRGVLTVSRIEVPKDQRSAGIGTDVMGRLSGFADQHGHTMALTPDGSFGGSVPRLKQFYSGLGFKPNTGPSRDLSISETMLRQPTPGAARPGKGLDWRTLDLMKQGMQDTISEAKRQGIGANDQGATKQFLSRFVAKLDGLNPDYKSAREAFAGPTAMKDALEEGRTLLSEDAPVVAASIASRPESERQMLRLGALQALQTKLGNQNVTFDAASQAGLMKPNQLARFKALFPDPAAFADFYRSMQAEKTMFGTNKAAFGNSTTAKQMLNVMEPSDPQIEGMTQAAAAGGSGNIIGLVRAIHRMGMESPMSEDTAATIASVLSSHDAENLPQVIGKMTQAQKAAALADVIRKSNGTAAGVTASRTVQRDQ